MKNGHQTRGDPFLSKRIRVTLDLTIPAAWTIGKTEKWLESLLRGCDPVVHEQRLARDKKGS